MDPLSEEYFHTLEVVKKELDSFKREQIGLRDRILKLFQENRRLTNELRENMMIRDHELSEKGIHELGCKLQSSNAAKETALMMWQEAMQQLEKQEQLLVGKKSIIEIEHNEVEKSIEQIKEHYQKGLMTLSVELSGCRSDLTSTKHELQLRNAELENSRKDLKVAQQESVTNKKLLTEITSEKNEMKEKLDSFQEMLCEKENLLSSVKQELDAVSARNLELQSIVDDLREQNKKLKYDVAALEKDAKESLFAAQEAILQRKEMAYREEQYIKEIEILKSSTGVDVQKAELKFKSKIKEIQEENTKNVQNLMEEIKRLHEENGEKQSLFEKVEREKKALESKLELLYSENSSTVANSNTFDDLCRRLTAAEKTRDEYELKIKSLLMDLDELKSSKHQEISSFIREKNILKERLANVSKDCNQSITERLKLRDELTSLKKKYHELVKELKFIKERQSKETSSLREEALRKQRSLNEQLHLKEEHYKSVCCELQNLLESQFKISSKWKEETEDLISKSEAKIIELCDTIAHLQYQNNELVNIMQKNNSY